MKLKVLLAVATISVSVLLPAVPAGAGVALTKSRPFEAVCESHGGTFLVAVDGRSLYCDKVGGLFTAFSERQLSMQRHLCVQVYRAFFGVQGFVNDEGETGTGTFCSVA